MSGLYGIVKVKGAKPERFLGVCLNPDLPPQSFMGTSEFVSEAGLRGELAKNGLNETEINAEVEQARLRQA